MAQVLSKGKKLEESDDDIDERVHKRVRNEAKHFNFLVSKALGKNHDHYKKLVNKFDKKGYSFVKAKRYAHEKMRDRDIRTFFELYKGVIVNTLHLRKSTLHQNVLEIARDLHKQGVRPTTATALAIEKAEDLFDLDDWLTEPDEIGEDTEDDTEEETDEEVTEEETDEEVTEEETDGEGPEEESHDESSSSETDEDTEEEQSTTEDSLTDSDI